MRPCIFPADIVGNEGAGAHPYSALAREERVRSRSSRSIHEKPPGASGRGNVIIAGLRNAVNSNVIRLNTEMFSFKSH